MVRTWELGQAKGTRMRRDEEGASMVEYALLIAFIAIIAVIAISLAGEAVKGVFEQVPPAFEGNPPATTSPPATTLP